MTNPTLTYRPLAGARLNMAHPLAKSMVLCMLLNEQGSQAMDLSPYGAHGALTGFGSPAKRAFNGLQFTAATPSYIEIPASYTQLDFTSEDFSLIARINVDSTAAHNRLFVRGVYNDDGWYCYISTSRDFNVFTCQAGLSQQSRSSGNSVPVGAWCTLGFSRSGASITIYIDGIADIAVADVHINPATCARTARIGILDNLSAETAFDGKIEFLYVWGRRSLTAFEQQAIHISPYNPLGTPLFI